MKAILRHRKLYGPPLFFSLERLKEKKNTYFPTFLLSRFERFRHYHNGLKRFDAHGALPTAIFWRKTLDLNCCRYRSVSNVDRCTDRGFRTRFRRVSRLRVYRTDRRTALHEP